MQGTKKANSRKTKQINKARKVLTKALKTNPNSLLLNTALAEIYTSNDDWPNADKIYQHLTTIFNAQPIVLNNAAFVALNVKDYDRALSLIQSSIAIAGEEPDSLDTMGWIYYQTQQFEQALPLFRKALAIDYSKQEIKFHLALTLKELNQNREAFTVLQEVVNSKRAFADKAKAKEVLDAWAKIIIPLPTAGSKNRIGS